MYTWRFSPKSTLHNPFGSVLNGSGEMLCYFFFTLQNNEYSVQLKFPFKGKFITPDQTWKMNHGNTIQQAFAQAIEEINLIIEKV